MGEEIKKFRKKYNLTREELAVKLGVSAPTIWRWEKGLSKPHKTFRAKLEKIMQGYKSVTGEKD